MTVKGQNLSIFRNLSVPISYRVLDVNKLFDAQNVFDAKGVTETRYGIKRYNSTSLAGPLLSASYFKTAAGTRYKLAKVGTVISTIPASGAATAVKSSLTATTKHRAVTTNNRHIVAVESDGLFSFNGTTFTQLGQAAPTTGTIANTGGGSLAAATYQMGLTFYSSATGFETNVYASNQVVTALNEKLDVTVIPATAANGTIDTVRVYLKNVTTAGSYLFVGSQALGITTYTISTNPTSTQIPPTTHAAPLSGGGKYLTVFGKKIAYTGNSTFLNEVYFSEENLPDAFNDTSTARTIYIEGQGPVTGIATGFYDQQFLNPFLAIFKKTSITIYSELNSLPNQVLLDSSIGCVSHDTIRVKNGIVYFMSENGFYAIKNGRIISNKEGDPVSFGNGDIDDVFTREGWTNQFNASNYANFFSAYHSTLKHYITWCSEGSNTAFYKAYVYEEDIAGFRVFTFKSALTCACEGEDDLGNQCIFIGDKTGVFYTYSIKNSRHDENESAVSTTIPCFITLPYFNPKDMGKSSNFKILNTRALSSANTIAVNIYPSFNMQSPSAYSLAFPNSSLGFILDVSKLDEGVLGDERVPVTKSLDVTRTAEALLISFSQDVTDANLALLTTELSYSRNNNRNL